MMRSEEECAVPAQMRQSITRFEGRVLRVKMLCDIERRSISANVRALLRLMRSATATRATAASRRYVNSLAQATVVFTRFLSDT